MVYNRPMPKANKWVIWSLIVGLNLGMFFLLKMIAHATVWAFAGPYLITFALPVLILVQIASWLRKWEKHRPTPKLLALCWGLSFALFVAAVNSALVYFSAKFRVFDLNVGEWIFIVGFLTLSAGILMYIQVLPVITARVHLDQP